VATCRPGRRARSSRFDRAPREPVGELVFPRRVRRGPRPPGEWVDRDDRRAESCGPVGEGAAGRTEAHDRNVPDRWTGRSCHAASLTREPSFLPQNKSMLQSRTRTEEQYFLNLSGALQIARGSGGFAGARHDLVNSPWTARTGHDGCWGEWAPRSGLADRGGARRVERDRVARGGEPECACEIPETPVGLPGPAGWQPGKDSDPDGTP
jgi:hypothetical protein